MAPLAPSNTPRYLIHYSSGGLPHTMLIRMFDDVLPDEQNARLDLIAAAMKPIMQPADAVGAVDFIEQGSNIATPYGHDISGPGTAVVSGVTLEMSACFLSCTGKDVEGRDVSVHLYTVLASSFPNYRQPIGVVGSLYADWWSSITSTVVDTSTVFTISGVAAFWKPYLNVGVNAYYQRKLRA